MEEIKIFDMILDSALKLSAGVATLIVVALLVRYLFAHLGGGNAVLRSMETELARLAAGNDKLGRATNELQTEVRNLRTENGILHSEIAALRSENAHLTAEILKLNDQIDKWDNKCATCRFKPVDEDNL